MKKDQNIIYYLFSISLVIVQIVFFIIKKKHFLEYIWGSSFIILSIVVFVLILIIPITKKNTRNALTAIVLVMITVVTYPLGDEIFPLLVFLAAGITCGMLASENWGLKICTFVSCIIICARQYPHNRWDNSIAEMPVDEVGVLFLFILIYFACLHIISLYLQIFERNMDLIKNQEQNIARLSSANLEFQCHATSLEKKSIDRERKRITRELHDSIGYMLTNITMMMEAALRKNNNNKELNQLLELTKEQAKEGLRETRKVLYLLREENIETSGLIAVTRMLEIFEKITGIHIEQTFIGIPKSMSKESEDFIYRFVQESVVNSYKHAHANNIHIIYSYIDGILYIRFEDDGKGCKQLKEGIGITGMRERLRYLGGSLSIYNQTDCFAVVASIPIDAGGKA